jgi:transcriptional regulator with XRE-family HTH domain
LTSIYLRDIEHGNKNPTVEILSLICEQLDVSLSSFFSDDASSTDFFNDPIIAKIYQLSKSQKEALSAFLDTSSPSLPKQNKIILTISFL